MKTTTPHKQSELPSFFYFIIGTFPNCLFFFLYLGLTKQTNPLSVNVACKPSWRSDDVDANPIIWLNADEEIISMNVFRNLAFYFPMQPWMEQINLTRAKFFEKALNRSNFCKMKSMLIKAKFKSSNHYWINIKLIASHDVYGMNYFVVVSFLFTYYIIYFIGTHSLHKTRHRITFASLFLIFNMYQLPPL